jgi:beta-lactam-binding protein with PASTA domain
VSHALRQRLGRVGLVVALLAAVLVVSFGSGYRASQAVLDDGSAQLAKGHTVVRVNGESGQVETKLTRGLAKGGERLRVVELPDGQLYVENTVTGARSKVDTTTMEPRPLPDAPTKDARGSLVGGGAEMYSVDRAGGTVAWIQPRTRTVTTVVKLGAPVQGVEVDSHGTAWVLAAGRLHEIARTEQRATVDVGDAGEPALLTLVGDRPTVLRLTAGEAVRYGRTAGDVQRVRVPDVAGRPATALAIAAPGAGDVLWVAVRQSRRLLRVDLPAARVRSVELRAGEEIPDTGRPVLSGPRVLVPDYKARVVHLVEAASGADRQLIAVPGPGPGSDGRARGSFDVVARGSKVYINDQYASRGVVVDRDGTDHTIDKGTGDGLDGSRPQPTPRRGPAPPPTRTLPTGPDPAEPGGAGSSRGATGPPAPRPPAPVQVPDVVGKDRAEACAALRSARLDCVEVPVGNDGAGPTGLVLRTAPAPGATVPVGQIVTVSYRDDIQLPELVGLPSAAACAALEAAGLVCERSELPAVAAFAAVDKVATQDPPPGRPARTGDRVRIGYPSQVLVPDVRGRLAADACAQLAGSGLACTQVDAGTRPAAESPNQIIDQAPASGTAAAPGTPVSVRFYSSVVVPQVTGIDPAAAAAAISAQGLVPVPVADTVTNQPNVVLQQSPAAGSPAGPGTQVQYVYEDAPVAGVRLYKRDQAPGDDKHRYSLEPQPGYSDLGLLGSGYGQPAGGTTAVYRYVCDGSSTCSGPGTFYYSMTNAPTAGPGWNNNGIAFYAYGQQADPAMVQIVAMFDGAAWVWAVPNTDPYRTYVSRGYTRITFSLGWVWPP